MTLRGNHRQPIFFAPSDRRLLNEILAAGIARCGARLHAYCWMTNHVHMLVQAGQVPLGALILRVAGRYARTVQADLQTTGHLFENRYHAVMVAADAHLLELLRYIHLNPVRAGLVDDVAAYPWSSHHAYSGRRDEPWLTTSFLAEMLDPNADHQRATYLRFVDSGSQGDVGAAAESDISEVPMTHPTKGVTVLPQAADGVPSSRETLSDLLDQAAARFGVSHEALLSPARIRTASRARLWIARTALDRGIASLSETSRFLRRDESSLRKGLARRQGQ